MSMVDLLQLNAVNKAYWRGSHRLQVLVDVTVRVGPSEVVAVVGARDEGKTTLLRLAAGIERPDEGQVLLDGQDFDQLSATERERLLGGQIAWVSRERPGIAWTACQFVTVPLTLGRRRRHARRLALAALDFVGAARCADQTWEELSNWERMLVGLARAYACRPRLIVVDDLLDGFGMLRMQEAGEILRSVVDDLHCGVLMSASGMEATLAADEVWSLGRGHLRPMTGGQPGVAADVIDFPRGVGWGSDSRRTGS